ncbi:MULTISPECIES: hypothetical protein [Carnobacterium]|uniref:hypothetical protein n=1 Tax=Carnobacterium TaxID=2747 RepID=UPI000D494A60|nr:MULTISPECIES: hypothetical protein [Carnobacterium]MCO6019136.1 hypothetical protein [Carnobacterium divergens]MDT1940120.1 hypothetical protein [Carnobacterium divergens]MDT1942558.1 hypothetical protein [Carnobacterium divergens]MDT1948364.1 hypothetical protein [Carnobacterium divergens]MDT1950844.1 hypothetical protein [Carnobacterium divergens]
MKKLVIISAIVSMVILGACSKGDVNKVASETTKTKSSKEVEKKGNKSLGDYKNLKLGDTVPIKYHESAEGKTAFDLTLNKIEFTDQALEGEEPNYESGFIIADITIKNTGTEPLEVGLLDGLSYGNNFSYGSDYGFQGFDREGMLEVGKKETGKMVVGYSKLDNKLTWGLEGFTTIFSYDIKADEIGNYVPE